MYSPRVVQERLKIAEQKLGFPLEYYSDKDREMRVKDLVSLKDPDSGIVTRKLDDDEIRFVRNERALITCDLSHYHRYATIIDYEGKKVHYKPNIAQRIMGDLRAEMEDQQSAIEIMNLKARRLGISTDDQIAIAHRTQCWAYTKGIVASADPEMSASISQIMEVNWNNMPWFLMPRVTRYNVGEIIGFGDMGSEVSIQAGSQLKGIGRGSTPQVIHLSEVAYYKNPEELIEASLLKAIIPNPYTLLMLETTAAGRFGWTYDTWQHAKENWPGGARLRPVFLPWYVGCLVPSSMVEMADGTLKAISEVESGDIVTSHTGKLVPVVKRIKSPRTNEVTSEIWLWGNFAPLSCTREHKVLTDSGWKEARTIKSGDFVVHPVRPISASLKTFDLAQIAHGSKRHKETRTIEFDFNQGRMIGLYLAEGSLSRNSRRGRKYVAGISIACHTKEVELFSDYVLRATGRLPKVSRRTASLGAELRLNDSSLGRWIESEFGHADSKRIPGWVWDAGHDFCRGIVSGYLDGDGHVPEDKLEIAARSVRLQLHTQLRGLIASLGYGWSSISWFPASSSSKKGSRGGWWLNIRTATAKALREALGWQIECSEPLAKKEDRWKWCEGGVAVEVDRNLDGFSEEFYDLGIEDEDHSFTTIQCAVHNCDIYPAPTWLKQHPVPVGWAPHELTQKHAEQAQAYVRTSPLLQKYLGAGWQMPIEQMWWWEFHYREAKAKRLLAKFLAEIAADDESAFQTGNIPCFDIEILSEHQQRTKPPVDVYGFRGVEVAQKLHPKIREINPNKPPIDVIAHWNKVQEPVRIQLVPLLWSPADSRFGKLMVYEHPRQDFEYGFGVDTSDGIGEDRSVVNGIRKGTYEEDDFQSCLYSNPNINALNLWPILMAIATYYSTPRDGIMRQSRVAIECRGNGETTQLEMQKRGWSNFHPWMRMSAKFLRPGDSRTIGWYTMEWSRRMMLDWLINAIEEPWLVINANSTVSELSTLEIDGKKQKLKAMHRCHDDEVMSLGIALATLHLTEMLRNNAPDRRKNREVLKDFLRYKPPLSASSLPEHMRLKTRVSDAYQSENFLSIAERLRRQ